VSEKLPTREQALQLLKTNGCSNRVIIHCQSVAELAKETAVTLQKKGLNVNVELVEVGGLLHDIGRSKTHTVNHVVVGAEIAKNAGVPEPVVNIIKRHVGGGLTAAEAQELGWPKDNYVPAALEEKIVSYADKLVETNERVPIELTVNRLRQENLNDAADRVQKLYDEITNLLGKPQ
jgi:uncharacterized protein